MCYHLYEIVKNTANDCKAKKEVKKRMHANWDTRIPSMGLHYIAAFLDPSLKNLRSLVDYMESREDTMSEFIISIVSEMGITMQQLCPEEQSASEKQPADPEVKEIDPPTPSSSGCAAPKDNPSTLKQKLGPKERELDAKRQKILSKIFRIIHCIPATSSEIERVWSRSGLILNSRRSKLSNDNVKNLIFLKYNWDNVKSSLH